VKLHQWNFDLQGGHFVVWNPKVRTDVTRSLADIAETEATINDGWIFTKFRKR